MKEVILIVNSEYSHAKLEALGELLNNVDHVLVVGCQSRRWEQMIECGLKVVAISYSLAELETCTNCDEFICI